MLLISNYKKNFKIGNILIEIIIIWSLKIAPLVKVNSTYMKHEVWSINLVAPASPVHRTRYSTNWDRKGWPGSEPDLQRYPWKGCLIKYEFENNLRNSSLKEAMEKLAKVNTFPGRKRHFLPHFLSIKGYRCESDIVIFAWRVTWNYVYSPFKLSTKILTFISNIELSNTFLNYEHFVILSYRNNVASLHANSILTLKKDERDMKVLCVVNFYDYHW